MPIAVYIFIIIVVQVLSSMFMRGDKVIGKPTIDDPEFPQVDDGTPQPVIFGDCWSGDWTVLATGNYRTEAIRVKGSKK